MIVYVATPYSKYKDGIERAFIEAAQITAKLIASGIHAYSPICHTHPVAVYGNMDPLDHGIWLKFDQAMMNAASSLIVVKMDGWEDSIGIKHEIEEFSRSGKPISYLDPVSMEIERNDNPDSAVPAID